MYKERWGGSAAEMKEGVWEFLEVEEVAELELDDVREALEERDLPVQGAEKELRARLVKAIQQEEALAEGGEDSGGLKQGLRVPPNHKSAVPSEKKDTGSKMQERESERERASDMDMLLGPEAAAASAGRAGVSKGKVDTEGVIGAFDNALDDWFGDALAGSGRKFATVQGKVTKKVKLGNCPACGVPFQTVAKTLPGYIPESKLDTPGSVCVRCYELQHYGKVDAALTAQRATHAEVSPERFKELLKPIGSKKVVVCYVVDVFDFHGSFLADMAEVVGRNPVILALNKADLLPKDFHPNRVKSWVYREAGRMNIWVLDVILVSAIMGYGVQTLEGTLRELSNKRSQDVYILGSANVGKSTLVNRLIQRDFSLEDAPWKEEKRIKGKIIDDMEAQEAMLTDQRWSGAARYEEEEAMEVAKAKAGADEVYMGPKGEGWQTFRIEGLDLGELEEEEASSKLEEEEEGGSKLKEKEPSEEAFSSTSLDASIQDAAVAADGEGKDGSDGTYMGPKGQGWESFKIEGGVDLGLDGLDGDVEASGDEWVSPDAAAAADKGSKTSVPNMMQASFEYKPRQRESRLERQRKNEMLKGMGGGVTASFLPGTTLGITELDLGNGRSMFDTPGLIVPSQLTNRLEMEELAAVLPQKRVEHVTYRLNPGSCVHLGGLAYVELVDAPGARAFFFTIFVSNLISLHVGKADKASAFREQHVGQGQILSPPFRVERVQELGDLVPSTHTAEGDSWATACVDIVVSGLGWVAVTGLGPVTIRTWAPPGIEVISRDPLMPFEARTSTERYTGGGKRGTSRRTKKLTMPGQPRAGGSSGGGNRERRGGGQGGSARGGRGGGRRGGRGGGAGGGAKGSSFY